MRGSLRRRPNRSLVRPHPPRIGILGASKSARRVWQPIYTAGLSIPGVGARDVAEAEALIKACGGAVITRGDFSTSFQAVLSQEQSELQPSSAKVRACTYEELIDIREVDIVYVTIPVSERDVWVRRCLQQRKHILLSIPAAPTADILQKWMELAHLQHLLITDDAALMQGRRLERVCAMLGNSADKRVGPLRSLRVSCCCSQPSSSSPLPFNTTTTTTTSTTTTNNNNNDRNNNTHGDIESFSTTCKTNGDTDNRILFGVFTDIGWIAVAALLYVVRCATPATVLGHALQYGESKSKKSNNNIIEFVGELIFTIGDVPVTAFIYLNCIPSATSLTCTTLTEQSLIAHGTTGSLILHDLIVPAPCSDDTASSNTVIITLAVPEEVQDTHIHRHVRREEEVRVMEEAVWGDLPWRRLRDALSHNKNATTTSLVSHFLGNTTEALGYMKHTWATQTVVDALLNSAKISAELEAGVKS